jgi:cellulose synthase/poly-beta-1,6-N-acetylglucosamine synthase-like glycosyltransferase
VLNIGLVVIARGFRTATATGTALYVLANLAVLVTVAAAIDPDHWQSAFVFAPLLAAGALLLRKWTAPARLAYTFIAVDALLYVSYVFALTFLSGLGLVAMFLSASLLLFELAALSLTLMYAYEGFSALCRIVWSRRGDGPPPYDPATAPFVSIHIPTYSEPPDLVIETLNALAILDYPCFEVVIVDNNTKDAALWGPVQAHCARLGERFRFFHVDPLDGYKAGACNFALAHTDPRATLVAIIDADYVVDPAFLRDVAPYFRDPGLAFVQTPQDYRQFEGNRYLTDCLHAYAYFFAVSMTARNEDNAPIFGGTMGVIRRSVLEEIGGWDAWCITEDAEASLRILQRGYRSLYLPKSYGRGLMPFDFDSYKKQRFRWAFGGIQIFRKHWRSLLPLWPRAAGDRLTGAQRSWYLIAAFLWFGEPVQLAFAAFLFVGAVAYAVGLGIVARPLTEATLIFPLLFLFLGVIRFLWILRSALGLGLGEAVGAAVNMFSLSWVVAQAVLSAIVRSDGVFLRTSKTKSHATFVRAIAASRWETAIALTCLLVGIAILARGFFALGLALAILCFWQALIYGSAFVTSLSAIRSARLDARPARYRHEERPADRRALLWVPAAAGLGALAIFIALAGVATAPNVVTELNAASDRQVPLLPPAVITTPVPTSHGPATGPTAAPNAGATPVATAPPGASAQPSAIPQPTPAVNQPTPPIAQPTPPVSQPTPPIVQPTPGGGPPTGVPTPRGP